jgi:hypothetical protein
MRRSAEAVLRPIVEIGLPVNVGTRGMRGCCRRMPYIHKGQVLLTRVIPISPDRTTQLALAH